MHPQYKTVYLFYPENGAYAGEAIAYLDTLASTDASVYICPANTVDHAPPEAAPSGKAWFLRGNKWALLPDYSRTEVWRIADGQLTTSPPSGQELPDGLTTLQPPEPGAKQVRRWASDRWEIIADHRGETWYDTFTGKPVPVETVDVPVGLTDAPPPSSHHVWKSGKWTLTADGKAEALRAKRVALLADIAAKRYAVETGGLTFPDGMCVGTDRQDQAIITGVVSATQLGQVSFDWKGADGTWIALTAKQIMQIGAAVAAHVQACFSAEKQHCEAVAKLKDAELDGYNINAGWPSNTIGG